MKIKKSYLKMIKSFPGGMAAMAAAMGLSQKVLENRIYEHNGQSLKVTAAVQMQAFSKTTLFAEAVAAVSGGTFVKLPTDLSDGNEMLDKKFRQLYMEIGDLARVYEAVVEDDVVTDAERVQLGMQGDRLHKAVAELLALTFRVYCPQDVKGTTK